MQHLLLSFTCVFGFAFLHAQSTVSPNIPLTLSSPKDPAIHGDLSKMPCDPSATLMITDADAETPANGDNDPSDGAFMTWDATGSSTGFYYTTIESVTFPAQPVTPQGSGVTVYPAPGNDMINWTLGFGGSAINACIPADTYTIKVWEVLDANGDGQPDLDPLTGEIDGCFVETTVVFNPSCPAVGTQSATPTVTDIGCVTVTGSITLSNFSSNALYCVTPAGGGATVDWAGPGGFTGSGTSISGLAAGTYTATIGDFYGCPTTVIATVSSTPPVSINCNLGNEPSVFGASDGSALIDILTGSGNYTISWSGPSSGSRAGNNGLNTIGGLLSGDYTFTVTDDDSGCVDMCPVTIPIPPCLIDISISENNLGDITITINGGTPDYFVSYTGPTNQDDIGPFGNGGTTLSGGQFLAGEYLFTVYEAGRPDCSDFEFYTIEGVNCDDLTLDDQTISNPTCGLDNGSISLTVSGDDNPTIAWMGPGVNGNTSFDLTGLAPGTYSYTVLDDKSCFLEGSFDLPASNGPTFNCAAVAESGVDFNDGKIGLTLSGGTSPYTLSYTAVDTVGVPLPPLSGLAVSNGDSLRNLVPGTYTLVLEDAAGCPQTCVAVVDPLECPPPSPGSLQTVDTTAVIHATTVGGTGAVALIFGGPSPWTINIRSLTGTLDSTTTRTTTPDTVFGLPIGVYELTLIPLDNGGPTVPGCVPSGGPSPITFEVRGPECDFTVIAAPTNPSCHDTADGFISLNVMGAVGDVTVSWTGVTSDQLFVDNLDAGTYSAVVMDATGCSFAVGPINLIAPPEVSVDLTITQPIACGGEATGALQATVMNANGAVDFQWLPAGLPNAATLTGLAAGDYELVVTDGAGCTASNAITLTEPLPLDLNCGAVAETTISAGDGKVGFSIVGGTAPFDISLNNTPVIRPSDDTFRLLAPGSYTIEITDANDCTQTCTAVVNNGGCGDFTTTVDAIQPDCDNALGSATAQPAGGNGAVIYSWSNGQTTRTVTDLSPGTYDVTATDAFTCQAVGSVTITAFTDVPAVSIGSPTFVCDDACTELNVSFSGTPPYVLTFNVSRAGTQVPGTLMKSSAGDTTYQLCPADFGLADFAQSTVFSFLEVTDGNGCSRPVNEDRTVPAGQAQNGVLSTTLCQGDTLRYFGDAFFAGNTTGDVTLPFPASNGCDSIVSVTLTFHPPATGTFAQTICQGDTLTFQNEIFHANRTTGDVILPDASSNGCDSIVTVTVDFFAPATGTLSQTICQRDTLIFQNEIFHANRTTGDVILPDASVNGCDSVVTVTVDFFAPATGTLSQAICQGDTLIFQNETFHANRTTGEVVLPDASVNGCDSTITVVVSFFAPAFSALDTTLCTGDTLRLHGEIFHANRTNGDLVLPNVTSNGCDSTITVSLSFFNQPVGVFDTTICAGSSFVYGNTIFDAVVDDQIVVIDQPGTGGCDSLVAVSVRLREVPTVTLSGDGVICPNGDLEMALSYDGPEIARVVLSSNPLDTIDILSGTTRVNRPVAVGTVVTILGVDDGGPCPPEFSGSVTVTETNLAVGIDVMSGDGTFAVSCAEGDDGAVAARVSGGSEPYTFQWNTGDNTGDLDGLTAGDYDVMVTSQRGCQATASITLNSPEVMSVDLSRLAASCRDTVPALIVRNLRGGVAPYVYGLGPDASVPLSPGSALPDTLRGRTGSNVFVLEDVNGCRLEQTFDFAAAPTGTIMLEPRQAVIPLGDSVALTVLTDLNVAGYRLTPGPETLYTSTAIFVRPDSSTVYTVTAVDSAGCSASASVRVVVDRYVPIFAPNAFSPNEDGNNDLFRIYPGREVTAITDFNVFNRWGHLVFNFPGPVSPEEVNWGWDGRDGRDGRLHEQGTYVFSVTVTLTDGREVTIKGDLVLMR